MPKKVASDMAQFCDQPIALYDAGVEKYEYVGPARHYQDDYDPVKQRADAVSWLRQGGILVTNSALFSGMEASTVVLITRGLGFGVLARSEISRAVARLVVITNKEKVKEEVAKDNFNVIHLKTKLN